MLLFYCSFIIKIYGFIRHWSRNRAWMLHTYCLEKPRKRGIIDGSTFRASAEAVYTEPTVFWLLLRNHTQVSLLSPGDFVCECSCLCPAHQTPEAGSQRKSNLRLHSTHLSGVLLFPFSLTSSRSSEESTGEVVLVSSSSCSCWARYCAGFCLANLAQWSSSL